MEPRIVGYHPEFCVAGPGGSVLVRVTIGDWASEEEVLALLRQASPGARTMGELVSRLAGGEWRASSEILGFAVECCGGDVVPRYGWDDPVG